MNVARFVGVGILIAALVGACSAGRSRSQDGGAGGNDAAGDTAAGPGGASGGGAAGNGAAGQGGASGGGGAAGCTLLSDNSMAGCDSNGIVWMNYFCPPSHTRIGSCPYGCKPFGSFVGFNPVTDCNPAPADGGTDGGADAGGCALTSDNVSQSCSGGVVTTIVGCPYSQTTTTCPYGCRLSGMFGAVPSICKDAPIDAGCDGVWCDASVDADASTTH